MKRKAVLVIFGIMLSCLLISVNIWAKTRILPLYLYNRDTSHLTFEQWQSGNGYSYLLKYGGDLPALVWNAFWWEKLLFDPVSILLVCIVFSLFNPNKPKETGCKKNFQIRQSSH